MIVRGTGLAVALLLVGACTGQKMFQVTSYPPGANIYVDSSLKGTTDRRVLVDFNEREYAPVRLELDGYQPVGAVVSLDSPTLLYFVLQKSPDGAN